MLTFGKIMVHELKGLPANKLNALAMLNTLFPPDTAGGRRLPNDRILPKSMNELRATFYSYISKQPSNSQDLLNFENILQRETNRHNWGNTRKNLEEYLDLAEIMIKQANEVRSTGCIRTSLTSFRSKASSGEGSATSESLSSAGSANTSFTPSPIVESPKSIPATLSRSRSSSKASTIRPTPSLDLTSSTTLIPAVPQISDSASYTVQTPDVPRVLDSTSRTVRIPPLLQTLDSTSFTPPAPDLEFLKRPYEGPSQDLPAKLKKMSSISSLATRVIRRKSSVVTFQDTSDPLNALETPASSPRHSTIVSPPAKFSGDRSEFPLPILKKKSSFGFSLRSWSEASDRPKKSVDFQEPERKVLRKYRSVGMSLKSSAESDSGSVRSQSSSEVRPKTLKKERSWGGSLRSAYTDRLDSGVNRTTSNLGFESQQPTLKKKRSFGFPTRRDSQETVRPRKGSSESSVLNSTSSELRVNRPKLSNILFEPRDPTTTPVDSPSEVLKEYFERIRSPDEIKGKMGEAFVKACNELAEKKEEKRRQKQERDRRVAGELKRESEKTLILRTQQNQGIFTLRDSKGHKKWEIRDEDKTGAQKMASRLTGRRPSGVNGDGVNQTNDFDDRIVIGRRVKQWEDQDVKADTGDEKSLPSGFIFDPEPLEEYRISKSGNEYERIPDRDVDEKMGADAIISRLTSNERRRSQVEEYRKSYRGITSPTQVQLTEASLREFEKLEGEVMNLLTTPLRPEKVMRMSRSLPILGATAKRTKTPRSETHISMLTTFSLEDDEWNTATSVRSAGSDPTPARDDFDPNPQEEWAIPDVGTKLTIDPSGRILSSEFGVLYPELEFSSEAVHPPSIADRQRRERERPRRRRELINSTRIRDPLGEGLMDSEELRKLIIRKSTVQKQARMKEEAKFEVTKQVRKELFGKATGLISNKKEKSDEMDVCREFEALREAPEPPTQALSGGGERPPRPRYIPLDTSKYTSAGPKKWNKTKGKWMGTREVDIDYMKKH
jgi:hypothetical protein